MSADNGIYILECLSTDGLNKEWRVTHSFQSCIDYMYENANYSGFNKNRLISTFGNCTILKTSDELRKELEKIEEEYEWTEYGVCYLILDAIFPI